MSAPLAQLELAVLQRLREVRRAYTGLAIESYGAQLDDETFSWLRTLPAAWVTIDSSPKVERTGAFTFKVTAQFDVLVAQRHLQVNENRLAGAEAGQDVGVYQLLEDNKLALANRKLGLPIAPITPGAIRPVMKGLANRDAVAIYAQTFSTWWIERIDPDTDDATGDLLRVGLNYFLQPANPVPHDGPGTPNAADLVTTRNP